jgi:E3 SUMO-protein ligase PIAS1
MAVQLVEVVTNAQLLKQLPFRSEADVLSQRILDLNLGMKQQTEDDDLVATSDKISLKDSVVLCRIKTPIKSSLCKHIQCFDADIYFTMNRQTPAWDCAVCNKHITFESLAIDGYLDVTKLFQQYPQQVPGRD